MAAFETLLYKEEGPITHITINRPAALNALNRQVLEELHRVVDSLLINPICRVVVLSGAGEKAFVAGADIKEMSGLDKEGALEFARFGQNLTTKIESLPQIVIAKIHGFALGGGCELAMACDIIVASENAKFGQPEVGLGLIPGFGGTQRLVKAVGRPRAMEILVAGRMMDASEALQAGLIARVCPVAQLDETVISIVKGVLRGGPQAIALTKKLAIGAQSWDLERGLVAEAGHFGQCFENLECQDGMRAFIEKRPATFAVKL